MESKNRDSNSESPRLLIEMNKNLHSLICLVQLLKESKNRDNNSKSPRLLIEMNKNLHDYYTSVGHLNSLKGIEVRVSEVSFTIWEIKDADTGEVLAHSYF